MSKKRTQPAPKKVAKKPVKKAEAKPQRSTKQDRLIAMLRRPEGATVEQIAKALNWQHHTVRGAIAGALKKKLGLKVASTKEEAGRVYRITDAAQRVSA